MLVLTSMQWLSYLPPRYTTDVGPSPPLRIRGPVVRVRMQHRLVGCPGYNSRYSLVLYHSPSRQLPGRRKESEERGRTGDYTTGARELLHAQLHFESALGPGEGNGTVDLGKGHRLGDERGQVETSAEHLESGVKRAAPRSHHLELINHVRRRVEGGSRCTRRLEHQRAERTAQLLAQCQPFRVAGGVDYHIERPGVLWESVGRHHGVDAFSEGHLLGVPTDEHRVVAVNRQRHRAEQPEFAVANHGHCVPRPHHRLLANSQRRGERLCEGCVLSRHTVGNDVEVAGGQCEVLGVGAVLVQNTQHGAVPAVVPGLDAALGAHAALDHVAARQVDLADHPLPNQLGLALALRHLAHKLMAEDPRKPHVALHDLKVGVAHPNNQSLD
mmetsp:Transcript_3337/g.10249  ORF Transcript_3337/g.10249 Transcript_3337/m.10249 type:complete len:385 (+) Transcript_3337:215-1369(+)